MFVRNTILALLTAIATKSMVLVRSESPEFGTETTDLDSPSDISASAADLSDCGSYEISWKGSPKRRSPKTTDNHIKNSVIFDDSEKDDFSPPNIEVPCTDSEEDEIAQSMQYPALFNIANTKKPDESSSTTTDDILPLLPPVPTSDFVLSSHPSSNGTNDGRPTNMLRRKRSYDLQADLVSSPKRSRSASPMSPILFKLSQQKSDKSASINGIERLHGEVPTTVTLTTYVIVPDGAHDDADVLISGASSLGLPTEETPLTMMRDLGEMAFASHCSTPQSGASLRFNPNQSPQSEFGTPTPFSPDFTEDFSQGL